jgi:hypothetical protein
MSSRERNDEEKTNKNLEGDNITEFDEGTNKLTIFSTR